MHDRGTGTSRALPAVLWLCMAAVLAGCALPRGAAMQGEILRDSTAETRDIEVVSVTRDNLARLAAWPLPATAVVTGWPSGANRGPVSPVIATGDLLSLAIWESEENALLTAPQSKMVQLDRVPVSPTGTIFVPYVGEILVRGRTPDEARAEVQQRIDGVLTAAQVQLNVVQGRQNTADLVGGVARAGSYPLPDRNFTVLSLLAQGGGVTQTLNNPQLRLVREGRVYGTSVARLFADPRRDLVLRGGDKVIVEEDKRSFLALGAAGTQRIVPFPSDDVSALDAVTLIGGLEAGRANPGGVLILREYPTRLLRTDGRGPDRERVVFTLDLTNADGLFSARGFHLQPDDLVLVTESPITSVRTVFGLLGQVLGLSNRLSE